METFVGFLRAKSLQPKTGAATLDQFIDDNFLLLDDGILRELIAAAIENRNQQLVRAVTVADREMLGPWGEIIDTMKVVLASRQASAGKNFERVLELGRAGDKKGVMTTLSKLYSAGYVDYLFKDILRDTLAKCQADGFLDFVAMLQFVSSAVEKIESINKAKVLQEQQQQQAKPVVTPPQPQLQSSSSNVEPKSTDKLVPSGAKPPVGQNEQTDPKVTFAQSNTDDSQPVVVATATATIPDDSGNNDDSDDEADSVDSDDEVAAGADEESVDRFAGNEMILIKTNDFLQASIRSCNGDAKDLKLRIINACRSDEVDSIALLRVLKDNIIASERAEYTVKLKLLTFIKDFLYEEIYGTPLLCADSSSASTTSTNADGTINTTATTHHAPKFVDSNPITAAELEILFPSMFLDGSQCRPIVCPDTSKINKKKKKTKKAAQDRFAEVAQKIARHYEENGWAVCDNFLPLELVHQIRMEAGLFTSDYEQSEIWVGKQADVGAHLVVPSVRGDKVLWMCGNHLTRDAAPEGVTRNVKTYGEIEPCRLDVKAKAPLRRFHAMKQVAAAMNNFVDSLKSFAPSLSGIYERSDCMLAIYPGNGARFARHVDNTTGDGRRLSMLVYLNPHWDASMGGCLRLTPPGKPHAVDILPMCGRLAIFASAEMPHEVMPTYGERHSLTIWFYDRTEREAAIARAKEAGHAETAAKASETTQREAKAFIADLMGGDEVSADGGEPTVEDLRLLAGKVKDLSGDALKIVSSITGAPSEESFRTGFDLLTPNDLKSMRQLFRRMGLQ
jgi:Rps23 Pro-64 3,4-dihydroxylase Tpa1-like proline 4-hydroxylase